MSNSDKQPETSQDQTGRIPEFSGNRLFVCAERKPKRKNNALQTAFDVVNGVCSPPLCPECGNRMEVKSGERGLFYSCTLFPRCKGTVELHNFSKKPKRRHKRRA